ncbi:uncharacterized protein METZ01_LOCUS284467 [marine metagenome]|uniref:Uncharacterized protein n=1 Tax=marine metagenome TaxID=408172 RepID=A0A382L6R2_9ZZZZ
MPIKCEIDVESFVRKISFIFLFLIFVLNIAQPVFLSLIIKFKNLLNLFPVKSSRLLAIVNLVKGLYSSAVMSNL